MIVNGKYKARATGQVVLGESAQKGTPFIELYFQIIDGENKGGECRWTSYFTDKTTERTIESMQHCGWSGENIGEFADGGLHGLDANEVQIVVELESYEDRNTGDPRTSPRVKWVNKLGGFLNVENAMKKSDADAFGERMRGLVLKAKAKRGSDAVEPSPNGTSVPDTSFDFGANVSSGSAQAPAKPRGW